MNTIDVDMFRYEKELLSKGYQYIAGVDEVGRGPLAGDLVVAATIMNLEDIVEGVNDSKKLTEKKREKLFPEVINKALSYSIVHISPQIIDEINIYQATKLAMQKSIQELSIKPDYVLVDAVKLDLDIPNMSIIKGDANSYSIAAASIIAKVIRDREMVALATKYPQYGFEKNKGYGTAVHINALKEIGATDIHRRTFISNFVNDVSKN